MPIPIMVRQGQVVARRLGITRLGANDSIGSIPILTSRF